MYVIIFFLLFGAIAALMVSGMFQELDNQIILSFENIRLPFLNDVMLTLTDFGISALLVPIMLIFSVVLFMYKRYHSIMLLFLLYIAEKTVNHELKGLFARERPAFDHLVNETYYSFPSGHSMNAATIYPFIAYLFIEMVPWLKKRQKAVYMVTGCYVLMIGISRMYIGVHYVTDVAGGFAIGLALFLICKKIDEKLTVIRQK
ncbi:phosphatase PAP2 family protein [Bacillus altitudinis MN12]|uniref:phosphatase PAP2 family protein n=1 Tax=Bacillus TaxID=1386 RepID=UPI000764B051|nr:phosphatase PAP2 family protein [Bacillus altitudinis]MBR0583205.1 phosphatase PAP2 family protein [Bacillus altitudinis MN12]MBR0592619.1 phosphatase PAP2 family protein [Bacillus altitudinis C16B11]MCA1015741.1 phosphatase PAP2 family protein [Bacillus stratosphericus]MBR0610565.1 phosphatase PAP2 family protein [Bacillus altitudinis]MCA2383297.1 phosphatase PAP2 family protein [Bacillus stratosphericus]